MSQFNNAWYVSVENIMHMAFSKFSKLTNVVTFYLKVVDKTLKYPEKYIDFLQSELKENNLNAVLRKNKVLKSFFDALLTNIISKNYSF